MGGIDFKLKQFRYSLRSRTNSPQACYLLNLPIPIFDKILLLAIDEEDDYSTLPNPKAWKGRTRTLVSCSRVCRSFRARSQPLLWKKVRLFDDKSARLWLESGGTARWETDALALQGSDLCATYSGKVIQAVKGLKTLEVAYCSQFDAAFLQYPSLAGLKSLIILLSKSSATFPVMASFSLEELWLQGFHTDSDTGLAQSLLKASMSSLKELRLGGIGSFFTGLLPPLDFAVAMGRALHDYPPTKLCKLQIDEDFITGPLLLSLLHCPSLSSIWLDGTYLQLRTTIAAIPPSTSDQGIDVRFSTPDEAELVILEGRLGELGKLGVKSLKVDTRKADFFTIGQTYGVLWRPRARPSEGFGLKCDKAKLSYNLGVGEEHRDAGFLVRRRGLRSKIRYKYRQIMSRL